MKRSAIEGLEVFDYVTGNWNKTVFQRCMATFDPVVMKLYILGLEFVTEYADEDEAVLISSIRDEHGNPTRLRISSKAYERIKETK